MTQRGGGPTDAPTTDEALIEAGRRCFAESGYAGALLATIVQDVGLTTGAFYRRYASKAEFFHALFVLYGEEMQAELGTAPTLVDQFAAWIRVSRKHRGVVRASIEMLNRGPQHAMTRQRLRGLCAGLLARNLEPRLTWRDARGASLVLSDILDEYVLKEAAGWIEERDPDHVASTLGALIERGLYPA